MAARSRTAEEWLREGRRWVEEGAYDAALESAERALVQRPGDPQILFLLGRVSADLERLAPAREYFEQVLAVDPTWNDGAAARALDQVREQRESVEEALANCRQVLRVDNFCAEAFFAIALWLRRLGLLEDALLSLADAQACGWDRSDVLLEMGEVHMERRDFEAAVDCLGASLEIDPTIAHAWYIHAAALRQRGDYGEALRSVERSLQLGPTAAARWLRDDVLDALAQPDR